MRFKLPSREMFVSRLSFQAIFFGCIGSISSGSDPLPTILSSYKIFAAVTKQTIESSSQCLAEPSIAIIL